MMTEAIGRSEGAISTSHSFPTASETLNGLLRQDYREPVEFLLVETDDGNRVPDDLQRILPGLRVVRTAGTTSYDLKNAGAEVVEREVRDAANAASNVRLDLRWIPPDEVQTFFVASDLVVLPYRQILNSGAVVLGLTFERPVLVPDLGSMREQQEAFGADWIRLYAGDLTPAELAGAVEWVRTTPRAALDLEPFDWPVLARRTLKVYGAVLSGRRAIGSAAADKGRTWTGA